MSEARLVVGLDAGASKTRLRAEHTALPARIERVGDGANPNRGGVEATAEVLVGLVEAALRDVPAVEQLSICAGVAGAGRVDAQQALADALRAAFGETARSVQIEVVPDAVIAIDAAYDDGSGVVVIAGTGSMVLARTTGGSLRRAGGWGHVLGDDGSGYALGRAGLRAVAEAFDGGAGTALRARVRDRFGIDDRDALLRAVYRDPFDVSAVAPLVVDAAAKGDEVASSLLSDQVTRLAKQVEWVLGRGEALAPRITLLGGLLRNDHYAQCLRRALKKRVPDWTVEQLRDDPVVGALRRARRLQSDTST